ncbi:hypothetical protein KC363_g88 [Hortaea werneckii]|nr:hypothetical protein KC363_g88 [Hortaea werneckii]
MDRLAAAALPHQICPTLQHVTLHSKCPRIPRSIHKPIPQTPLRSRDSSPGDHDRVSESEPLLHLTPMSDDPPRHSSYKARTACDAEDEKTVPPQCLTERKDPERIARVDDSDIAAQSAASRSLRAVRSSSGERLLITPLEILRPFGKTDLAEGLLALGLVVGRELSDGDGEVERMLLLLGTDDKVCPNSGEWGTLYLWACWEPPRCSCRHDKNLVAARCFIRAMLTLASTSSASNLWKEKWFHAQRPYVSCNLLFRSGCFLGRQGIRLCNQRNDIHDRSCGASASLTATGSKTQSTTSISTRASSMLRSRESARDPPA